ncbi:MAG TPA: alpha/beta fold hydrolase [Spongiibacteraceae bacterium]|nr:alpha/beta fold hydrolase [Spongiibacteraceae bacterium]
MTVRPFRIDIPQIKLDWIAQRLRDAPWPDVPEGEPWYFGTDDKALRELVAYWLRDYDWREHEAAFNALPQFVALVDDYDIHFIHVRGAGENPRPLLLSHGWPGSFAEFMKVIEPLTNPEKFGGNRDDAFSVVIPSLPGYGFSSKPKTAIGPRTIAKLFDKLMTDVLGYDNYVAQGGDWGSAISSWLGYEGKGCAAVHLNFVMIWRAGSARPETSEEKAAMQHAKAFWKNENGYMVLQSTKPLTLSYAMHDSPLGVAAWLLEKFHRWSDKVDDDVWSAFSKDEIITDIMLYLVTDTFGSASWLYNGVYKEPVPDDAYVRRPTGIALFPKEIAALPRSLVAKSFNIVQWHEMPRGGHFAALEQPELFVDDLRQFRRLI